MSTDSRLRFLSLVLAMFAALPASAQVMVDEAGRTIARTVTTGTTVYGMAVDPNTGDVYFIGDNGRDLYRLQPDNTLTQIADNVGVFVGQLSDLAIGADRRLYAMTTSGTMAGTIQRFELDGTELSSVATIPNTAMSQAAGLAFNCVDDILISDREVQIFSVDLGGDVSTLSVGWNDVDNIAGARNNVIFVQDGSARSFGFDKVFVVEDSGTTRLFATGVPGRIFSGAYDWATGDYFALNYTGGELYRLTDPDGDLVADTQTLVADGFGANQAVDVQWARSSADPGVYSLYIARYLDGEIIEITGFPAPTDTDCGDGIDDDNDGYCEAGIDLNGDGDCLDVRETPAMGPFDCDDTDTRFNAGEIEASVALCSDGIDSDCDGDTDLADEDCEGFVDGDGDGFCTVGSDLNGDGDCVDPGEDTGAMDCDDMDARESPGNTEDMPALCRDLRDNDCDGDFDTDDSDCAGFTDDDGDGFCENGEDINDDGDCLDLTEDRGEVDCNDAAAAAFPGNVENCSDGLDNDCDGDIDLMDADCADRGDDDGDGFCETGEDLNRDGDCLDPGEDSGPGDCNDGDVSINPDATEVCDDDTDNDCNGLVDGEDAVCTDVTDGDGDGFCEAGRDLNGDGDCLDPGEDAGPFDCNDMDRDISPAAFEISVALCTDGVDNDCDSDPDLADSDCGGFVDSDDDGFCGAGVDANDDGDCLDDGELVEPFDCDDTMMLVSPVASEVCGNGLDDDCDGLIDRDDEDCATVYDEDGDGFCETGTDMNGDGDCLDDGEDTVAADCDDTMADVSPDASEVCDDGIDNDCDGGTDLVDDDCAPFSDGDGDGVCPMGRDMNDDRDCLDEGEDTGAVDCDDTNELVSPELDEICGDGLDNDCNGLADADDGDLCTGTIDADGDGWCPAGRDMNDDGDCLDEGEDVDGGDCNDDNAAINPDAEEICDDEIDNNCDSAIDSEDASCDPSRFDADDDGWCPTGQDLNDDGNCTGDGEDSERGDCDDTNPAINPDAEEICDDGIDNNCDLLTDGDAPACGGGPTTDGDGDGYCALAGRDLNGDGDCDDEGENTGEVDCDDDNAEINPGAVELCGDGVDNNCSGEADEAALCDMMGGAAGGAGCACGVATAGDIPWVALMLLVFGLRRRRE
ncbi:MAG: MopE-related protein [Myxococcota bacterium]